MMPPADRVASPTLYYREYYANLAAIKVLVNAPGFDRPMLSASVASRPQNFSLGDRTLVAFFISRTTISCS